jgi:hypothetical protein
MVHNHLSLQTNYTFIIRVSMSNRRKSLLLNISMSWTIISTTSFQTLYRKISRKRYVNQSLSHWQLKNLNWKNMFLSWISHFPLMKWKTGALLESETGTYLSLIRFPNISIKILCTKEVPTLIYMVDSAFTWKVSIPISTCNDCMSLTAMWVWQAYRILTFSLILFMAASYSTKSIKYFSTLTQNRYGTKNE